MLSNLVGKTVRQDALQVVTQSLQHPFSVWACGLHLGAWPCCCPPPGHDLDCRQLRCKVLILTSNPFLLVILPSSVLSLMTGICSVFSFFTSLSCKSQGCAISLESALWLGWTPQESWTPPSSPFKVWVYVSCCIAYLMAACGESGFAPLLPMTEEGIPRLMSITGSPDTNTTELAMFSQPHRLFPILEATSPPSPRGKVWLRLLPNSSLSPWLTGLDPATFQDAAVVNKLKEHDINKLKKAPDWEASQSIMNKMVCLWPLHWALFPFTTVLNTIPIFSISSSKPLPLSWQVF